MSRIVSSGLIPLVSLLAFSIFRSVSGKRRSAVAARLLSPEEQERRDLYVDPGFDREMAERRRAEERLRIATHRSG